MTKLWGGRFKKDLDPDAVKLSYSLSVDYRLFPYDLQVNLAHAKALKEAGILTDKELSDLTSTLNTLGDTVSEEALLSFNDEDVHSCVERLLTEALGDLGKKIHTGKSRNDQVVTDVRLYLKSQVNAIITAISALQQSLYSLAEKHTDVIIPGMTHFQPAQPVLFSHHLLAYFEKFDRDRKRYLQNLSSIDVCPLGSAALAGSNYPLDRELIKSELGFSDMSSNSMDAVSDRDFIVEFLSHSALFMTHLSRFCEEIILWNSPYLGFIELDDAFTTGSSIMPQKKNPDIAELIRGKSSQMFGNLSTMLHLLKSLPLTYNRDLQEDKAPMFDTVESLLLLIPIFTKMISTISLNKTAITTALDKGYLLATEVADYLVHKGIPFRDTHEITGQIVLDCIEKGIPLEACSIETFRFLCPQIDEDIYAWLTTQHAIDQKNVYGGTATNQVTLRLNEIKGDTDLWKEA